VNMKVEVGKIFLGFIPQVKLATPDEAFHSLSCNCKNRNEFAVGTSSEVMIFDIRQMKEPRIKIDPRLGTMANEPRQIDVSWSPNGKYIFTHGPIISFGGLLVDWELPEVNDQPGQSISCFWDVQNEKRIGMSVDVTSPMERSMPAHTWIDDNLVVGSRSGSFSGVHSMAPNSSKTENINDFEVDSNGVGHRFILLNQMGLK